MNICVATTFIICFRRRNHEERRMLEKNNFIRVAHVTELGELSLELFDVGHKGIDNRRPSLDKDQENCVRGRISI